MTPLRFVDRLKFFLERGLTPVSLKHHIAVLGWTSRTVPLIAKLLGTTERMRLFLRRNDASRLRIVALAEEVSAHRNRPPAAVVWNSTRAGERRFICAPAISSLFSETGTDRVSETLTGLAWQLPEVVPVMGRKPAHVLESMA
ncbi:MAG: hypothetical protein ACQEQ1_00820 [Pseudomonadota bacterium]